VASSRSSVLSPSRPDVLGCDSPRVFTPPLRRLTPKTTLGFALIDFARDVLDLDLLPWQQWLAVHALELLPDGTFRFRTVVLLVARQNGKSTFLQILALFFLYVRGVPLVIGTAQNLDIAEEVWQGAVDMAENTPELAMEIADVIKANGKTALKLRQGERYKVQAASRRGGRGLSGDLVLLDELREHKSWDAWGAVAKTTMARPLAQVWAVSNAGDRHSVVLDSLRRSAHLELGDPDGLSLAAPVEVEPDDSLGLFEWSAEPGCDITDRAGWAQANPSLGHTITARAITSALRTDPDAVFRTEVLCQWVDSVTPSAIDLDLWLSLGDPDAPRGAAPVFGVAVAPDRAWSAIAVAWRRPDGLPQVMSVEYAETTAWVTARIEGLRATWGGEVVLSPTARGLVPDVSEELTSATQAQADIALADAVTARGLRHGNEGELRRAIRGARWPATGAARVFEPKDNTDISPLKAAAAALHGLSQARPSGGWMVSLP
jgi:hypothetical protein